MANKIIWTREDLEIIQKYYPIMDTKIIKLKFFSNNNSVTPPLINHVASTLRLKKKYDCRKKWTDEEVAILMKYYPTGGANLCAKYIKRKVKNIQYKARILGIRVKPELRTNLLKGSKSYYTPEELSTIKYFYPMLGATILQKTMMPNRSVQSIGQTAHKYGIYYSNSKNNLKDFIKKNILQCSTKELAERAKISEKAIKDMIHQMKKLGLLD